MNPIFINGMAAISPQHSLERETPLLEPVVDYSGQKLVCIEPAYEQFIDPKNLRRMSRILKMGTAASSKALQDANIKTVDGIITGTGFGCLEDTGNFINKIVIHHEEALTPTPFIQSTHNTIGSQIALLQQCQGYNQTYTQESLSFESCLVDTMLMLSENPEQNFLTGCADEITTLQHQIVARFGVLHNGQSVSLMDSAGAGTMQGEGTSYFVFSGKKGNRAYASVDFISTSTRSANANHWFASALHEASISEADIDLVLLGKNGIVSHDDALEKIIETSLNSAQIGYFKHLCGEFPTASGFAVWLAARILHDKIIPSSVVAKETKREPKTILILNSGLGNCLSLILMRAC